MKVLLVNVTYGVGSTGKIMEDIFSALQKRGEEVLCAYGAGQPRGKNCVRICSAIYRKTQTFFCRLFGVPYGGCYLSTRKLETIIKKFSPDVVHLHCLNGNFVNIYKLVEYLKKNKIKTVLTLHAEFMHTANCSYAFSCDGWKNGCRKCPDFRKANKSWLFNRTGWSFERMKKSFSGFNTLRIISCSEWLKERAESSPIFIGSKIQVIHNGIRIDDFSADPDTGNEVLKKYRIPMSKPIILFVSSNLNSPIKRAEIFEKLAERLSERYTFVAVGAGAPLSSAVVHIPFVDGRRELASLYKRSSVFVITSQAENYPTVCIEANACGLPVVGFDVGGVKETISRGLGETVPEGRFDLLEEAVLRWAEKKISDNDVASARLANDASRMAEEYLALYGELTK